MQSVQVFLQSRKSSFIFWYLRTMRVQSPDTAGVHYDYYLVCMVVWRNLIIFKAPSAGLKIIAARLLLQKKFLKNILYSLQPVPGFLNSSCFKEADRKPGKEPGNLYHPRHSLVPGIVGNNRHAFDFRERGQPYSFPNTL